MGNWLKKYIDRNKNTILSSENIEKLKLVSSNSSEEYFLYELIQPSGLIYGCPVALPLNKSIEDYIISDQDEVILVLLEGFINLSIYHQLKTKKIAEIDLDLIACSIGEFYEKLIPASTLDSDYIENIKPNPYSRSEFFLQNRTEIKDLFVEHNFTSYFFYSILFFDLLFYEKYLVNPDKEIHTEYETILLIFIKILISASYSNDNKLEKGEKILFKNFIQSIKLNSTKEKEILKYLNEEINVENIDFTPINTGLLRKICFEISLLVVWSDNFVTPDEQKFLTSISKKLNISENEQLQSLKLIQKFILENCENKILYENKVNYQYLHNGLISRLTSLIKKNKEKILNEIRESKELVELLTKSTNQELSKEEKVKVKVQLLDILKTIPSMAIFLLPGGAILLPILLKIIPKQILMPSSFIDKEELK